MRQAWDHRPSGETVVSGGGVINANAAWTNSFLRHANHDPVTTKFMAWADAPVAADVGMHGRYANTVHRMCLS